MGVQVHFRIILYIAIPQNKAVSITRVVRPRC